MMRRLAFTAGGAPIQPDWPRAVYLGMRVKWCLVQMFFLFWGASAHAACEGRETVLDCPIGSKHLTVCIGGGEASYAYGPKGAPELAITQPLGQVQGTAWAGVGRSIWEEIIFTNGEVTYAVWHSLDRMDENHATDGGVVVTKGDQTLADLQCRKDTAEVTIFAISDGFAEAGYCWDRENYRFARSCGE